MYAGHSSDHDVQVAAAARLDDSPPSTDLEASLENAVGLGRIRSVRQDYRPEFVWRVVAAAARTSLGRRDEAADVTGTVDGICTTSVLALRI